MVRALGLQGQQLALDRADGGGRDVAVLGADLVGMVGDVFQRRLKVLQVQQQQAVLVGDVEGDVQHAFLGVVQLQQARQEQRAHLGDGRADRMAFLAEQVPEHHRRRGRRQHQVH
jgi:ribosomal protein S28E/S33